MFQKQFETLLKLRKGDVLGRLKKLKDDKDTKDIQNYLNTVSSLKGGKGFNISVKKLKATGEEQIVTESLLYGWKYITSRPVREYKTLSTYVNFDHIKPFIVLALRKLINKEFSKISKIKNLEAYKTLKVRKLKKKLKSIVENIKKAKTFFDKGDLNKASSYLKNVDPLLSNVVKTYVDLVRSYLYYQLTKLPYVVYKGSEVEKQTDPELDKAKKTYEEKLKKFKELIEKLKSK